MAAFATDAGSSYQAWLYRADGVRLARLTGLVSEFEFTHVVGGVGAWWAKCSSGLAREYVAQDRRIGFWRKPRGGTRSLEFMGLLRDWDFAADSAGQVGRQIAGPDLNTLLEARHVMYPAGSAQADKTDQVDDLMKAVVRENLGSSATVANGRERDGQISSAYFSVAADVSLGPSVSMGFAYEKVDEVLRKVAERARQAGTEVFFGIRPTNAKLFQFHTWVGQPGADRTVTGPTFGLEFNNLTNPRFSHGGRDEVNVGFGLGMGPGEARNIQVSVDTTRSTASVLALREGVAQANFLGPDAAVGDAADGVVVQGRPQEVFTAELLSAPGSVYGKDWRCGDRVPVTFDGMQFEALIRAVTVHVTPGHSETVHGVVEAYL